MVILHIAIVMMNDGHVYFNVISDMVPWCRPAAARTSCMHGTCAHTITQQELAEAMNLRAIVDEQIDLRMNPLQFSASSVAVTGALPIVKIFSNNLTGSPIGGPLEAETRP